MIVMKKTCRAGWVVYFAIGLIFAVPCMAQDAPTELSPRELFEKKLSLKIKESRLSGKEVKKLGFEDNEEKTDVDYDGFVYMLEFRNGAEFAFDDLKVECRLFFTEESHWRTHQMGVNSATGSKSKSEQKYYEDSLEMSLKPMGRYKPETRPFVIQSWALTSGYYFDSGAADEVDSDVDGLWVRVYYTTPDGEKLQRDFCEPKSLLTRTKWVDAPKTSKSKKKKK